MKFRTYIALLRGINVGGKNMIPMAVLKKHFEQHGFSSVSTYQQSGNVVFQSDYANEKEIEYFLKKSINEAYSLQIEVIVKYASVLSEIILHNPFENQIKLEGDKTGVAFLSEVPSAESILKIQQFDCQTDEYFFFHDYFYIYCPNGFGRARLTNAVLESKLKLKSTIRNWKTIHALAKISKTV
jgi:uncharacterized protein (DUF1697 family)